VAEVVAERERLGAELASAGAQVFPSAANFLMIRVGDPDRVWEGLKAHGVLVKNFHKSGTLLEGCLRVTIGSRAENDVLLAAMRELAPLAVA
jgi:histidinol-phosphate aminotransferase